MSLQDHLPVIDDRSYDSLIDEIRARIPRYTPEWSNLNETDPGIIIMELFAWLSEMQIYRMSQVPSLHYLKFLELLGIELEPAKAAQVKLSMQVTTGFSQASVIVPTKTQFSSTEPDENGKIIFETDQAHTLIRAKLTQLQVDDGFTYRDLTNDNLDTVANYLPFGPTAVADNSFMLGFDEALPNTNIQLSVWMPLEENERVVSTCYSDVNIINTSHLIWEYWNGREWRELVLLKDDTAGFIRTGDIVLTGPEAGSMVEQALGEINEARYWIRCRIVASAYEEAPKILTIRTNTFAVTQAQTYEFESLGGSNGEIDQILRLRNTPVIADTLILQVDDGAGFETWQEVPDFFASDTDDAHYVLNRTTGEVRFGNSRNGRVPVANAGNRNNVRALIYRAGGGKRGNLGEASVSRLLDSVNGIDANTVNNLFEAAGGADEESLDEAIRQAPNVMKSQERAVTEEDYEFLALRAANIARAKALPLYHPDYPGIDVPGVVTVIVIPDVDSAAPVPSEGTLQTVCEYLNQRRLLTSELHVMGPTYKTITVRAELVADDTADLAEIKSQAMDSLKLYFHPVDGGENSDPQKTFDDPERSGGGWPFGGDIYYSLLYKRLLFNGVRRIVSLEMEVDGVVYQNCRDVLIDRDILLTNGEHEVQVNYEVGQ